MLEPKWVTEGVYKIINCEELARNRGLLKLRRLPAILALEDAYPRDKQRYIIDLMKKFELCYEIDKSTVLVPSGDTPEAAPRDTKGNEAEPFKSGLGVVSKEINQERLNAYAKVSGDDNPLHLDPAFAAATQFGGIIAHGMLTLAFVSEMMAAAHGRNWLESGSLRVRFKGAAYLGDRVEAWGNLAKEQESSRTYSVGVRNATNGKELITGSAGFTINNPR